MLNLDNTFDYCAAVFYITILLSSVYAILRLVIEKVRGNEEKFIDWFPSLIITTSLIAVISIPILVGTITGNSYILLNYYSLLYFVFGIVAVAGVYWARKVEARAIIKDKGKLWWMHKKLSKKHIVIVIAMGVSVLLLHLLAPIFAEPQYKNAVPVVFAITNSIGMLFFFIVYLFGEEIVRNYIIKQYEGKNLINLI